MNFYQSWDAVEGDYDIRCQIARKCTKFNFEDPRERLSQRYMLKFGSWERKAKIFSEPPRIRNKSPINADLYFLGNHSLILRSGLFHLQSKLQPKKDSADAKRCPSNYREEREGSHGNTTNLSQIFQCLEWETVRGSCQMPNRIFFSLSFFNWCCILWHRWPTPLVWEIKQCRFIEEPQKFAPVTI